MDNQPMSSEPKEIPVELIQVFLGNQTKELEIKAQELEIAKQEEVHNFEVTKLSIKFQSENFENSREHHKYLWKLWTILGISTVVSLTILMIAALWLGKEQFILEILRIVFYGGVGATAGSYYQKSKLLSQKEESNE